MSVSNKDSKYYQIRFMYNGELRIKSSKTTNKTQAQAIEAAWRRELINNEELGVKETITLKDACQMILDLTSDYAGHQVYKSGVKTILKHLKGQQHIHKLTSKHMYNFYSNIKKKDKNKPNTIKGNFMVLKRVINNARALDYKVPLTIEYPKLSSAVKKLKYLSAEEEVAYLNALNPDMATKKLNTYVFRARHELFHLAILLLDTGARHSEITGMTWKDIDFKKRDIKLYRPKVKNNSRLIMTNRIYEILLERKNESYIGQKYIFEATDGTARKYANKGFDSGFTRAGIEDCTIHTLRHTCASKLIQNGATLYEVQAQLGHKDIATTQIYAHLEMKDVHVKNAGILDVLNETNINDGTFTLQVVK